MKRYLIYITALLLLTACDAFDYHPYDVDIDGEQGINQKNIAIIERQTMDKDTLRVVFTGDTQGWLDETHDMVSDINQCADSIDFVVINGDIADFGLTFFYEITTCDLYLFTKIKNSCLSWKEVLSLSLGIKLQFI